MPFNQPKGSAVIYRNMKDCRRCGSPFHPSPADSTVNCPECRAQLRERAPKKRYACVVCCDTGVVKSRSATTGALVTFPCYGPAHR